LVEWGIISTTATRTEHIEDERARCRGSDVFSIDAVVSQRLKYC
jgi:hypothetical protein